MTDDHDKPTQISVAPSLIAFAIFTVITFGGMFTAMFYNHLGGF